MDEGVFEELSMNNELCETCKYRTHLDVPGKGPSRVVACYYIVRAGKRRGCETENCEKYEKGSPMRTRHIEFR